MHTRHFSLILALCTVLCSGCARYAVRPVDRVLTMDDGSSRWRTVWLVRLPGLLGTAKWKIISDEDLTKKSQAEIRSMVQQVNGLYFADIVQMYADALNVEVNPEAIRWVVGTKPLLIGIGTEKRPVTTSTGVSRVVWAMVIGPTDTTRQLEAILDYGKDVVLPNLYQGDVTLPASVTVYHLEHALTLKEVQSHLNEDGTKALRRLATEVRQAPVTVAHVPPR